MRIISCDIGYADDVQLNVGSKFEVETLLSGPGGLDRALGNSVTEITVTFYPAINFGIFGFRVEEPSDESVGYQGGDQGFFYTCFHTTMDINQVIKGLINKASIQKIPMGFNPSWGLKSKKVVDLNGLSCVNFVIGYNEFEHDLEF